MHSNRTLSPATTVMLTGPWVITGAEPAIKHTINANITAHHSENHQKQTKSCCP